MEIQKNITATVRRMLKEYTSQEEFAQELGIGHTTLQNILAGKGNPSAETIEILAKGMGMTPAQLISGEVLPGDDVFNLISSMVDGLHPTLQAAGVIQLEALRQLFKLSEDRYEGEAYWKYVVAEPRPFCYTLAALERTEKGWADSGVESEVFTDDHNVAEAAAELFNRYSLSPIHLEDAIEDYMGGL